MRTNQNDKRFPSSSDFRIRTVRNVRARARARTHEVHTTNEVAIFRRKQTEQNCSIHIHCDTSYLAEPLQTIMQDSQKLHAYDFNSKNGSKSKSGAFFSSLFFPSSFLPCRLIYLHQRRKEEE